MSIKKEEQEKQQPRTPVAFSKAQLIASKMFQPAQRDVLAVILDDSRKYTIPEAEKLIRETMERMVQ